MYVVQQIKKKLQYLKNMFKVFFHEKCTIYTGDDGVIDGTAFLSSKTGTLI